MKILRSFFTRSVVFALLSFAVLALSPGASAQTPGSGVITGTVANESSRQFLRNAQVSIAGTALSALTDADGSFRLANVPAGPQQVTVAYAGLEPETRTVTVAAGDTQRVSFALKSDLYELQQFVVAGDREGQSRAINDQKNADHIKSIVASDNFGDLVDSNAAELLKSVPGFAMNYAGEDAIGFVMRGQSSVNASIMMDGNGIPNS